MTDSDGFTEQQIVRPIQLLGPDSTMHTFVLFHKQPPGFGIFNSTISFLEVIAEDEDDGQSRVIELIPFDIGAADYQIKSLPDFQSAWESIGQDCEQNSDHDFHHHSLENANDILKACFPFWQEWQQEVLVSFSPSIEVLCYLKVLNARGKLIGCLHNQFEFINYLHLFAYQDTVDSLGVHTLCFYGVCCGVDTHVFVKASFCQVEERVSVKLSTRSFSSTNQKHMHALAIKHAKNDAMEED